MKKSFLRVFAVVMLCALLLGCGSDEWDAADCNVTTLSIGRDGKVLEVVVEGFGESYYSVEGLRRAMEDEIKSYAEGIGADEPPIVLGEVERVGNDIRTFTTYETTEDYWNFTYESLYYGSLRQGALMGFEMPSFLTDMEGAPYAVGSEDQDNHVVFTDGHDHIHTPYRILAYTDGVKIVSDREADFSGTDGRAALLLEK